MDKYAKLEKLLAPASNRLNLTMEAKRLYLNGLLDRDVYEVYISILDVQLEDLKKEIENYLDK